MSRENIPGLSLAVIQNGSISIQSYGVRNAESGELVNPETIFEAASLTKPVFALLVLELAEQGFIDLDRPLHEYIDPATRFGPDFFENDLYSQITARMVLSQSSGLPNGTARPGMIYFQPGERFAYSGTGFRYLAAAVEQSTEKPLTELLDETIFNPLAMSSSSFIWREEFQDNASWGHNADGKVAREILHLDTAFPEGGLVTNAVDYARFARHLLTQYRNGDRLVRSMLTPVVTAKDFAQAGVFSWGLGWGLEQAVLGKRAWHTGSNGVFKSFALLDLENDSAVIFFANGENGLELIAGLLQVTIGGSELSGFYQRTISESMLYPQ